MKTPIKKYIGDMFIGKSYHFKCDCIIPLDIIGTVVDYEISNNEIILLVQHNSKIVHVGLNAPSLLIEEV